MKSSSVRLLLGVSVLLLSGPTVSAVSLSVRPNLQQFFRDSKLTLRCDEEGQTADGLMVKRTAGGKTEQCGSVGNNQQNFGRIENSSCIISNLLPSDSGVYWCENSSGKISEHINITVTGGQLILEVPALPVLTGSDVTLRCRFRDGSTRPVNLLKNGEHSRAGPTGEFNISNVQQSDEGFYSCSVDITAESPRSRLRVKASPHPPPPPHPPTSSSSSPPPSVSPSPSPSPGPPGPIITVVAVLGSLVLLVLLLVAVLLLWRKQTGKTDSCPPADTTYADITITQTANRREKHPADPETVYSGVKTHTAGTSIAVQKKRRSQRERGPDPLYSAATLPPGTSIAAQKKRRSQRGPDDVTYSQVAIRGQGSAGVRPAQPDVVYSSVRSGK
ncbi:low affinity immunoglobulin gamma Fc region receptor II-like isoform X2 [Thunnus albacares]|uniref:low affinity immunoglobulin gamma Fc region receptor II-like isoform X2 n=1 Tax=Thunnus albacares TaxID=8236 RepID=UPI001CF650A6|nr:low affinity immunoglobulin gamma Fc region receptor II-like isoform X2 [Thunnus albacares]